MLKHTWITIKSLSRLKKILLSLLLSVSIVIALLTSVMYTEAGSHWAVRKLANMLELKLGTLAGNLVTGLDITSVDYDKNELSFHAEKISFRWQPLELFYTTVSVQSLSAEKIRLHLPTAIAKSEPESENYEWPSLAQPLRIKLENIQLHDIQIQQDKTLVPITSVSGSLRLGTFHLRATDFSVLHPQGQVKINGSMGLRYPYDLAVNADWQLDDKTVSADRVVGRLTLSGDVKTLRLQQDLAQPLQMKLVATVSPALHQPNILPTADLTLNWSEQALPPAWADYLNMQPTVTTQPEKPPAPNTTKGHINVADCTRWV
ncbi:MAG: hypothetical protein EOO68_20230 [Moraxellaceae bacterium]|nr:MAG: hypothetical protein EOO68_20230 [Moraxellaceae bacterium]